MYRTTRVDVRTERRAAGISLAGAGKTGRGTLPPGGIGAGIGFMGVASHVVSA
jgi:hypothetical protein